MYAAVVLSALVFGQVGKVTRAPVTSEGADVLVVCREQWLPALKEWWRWRESQGRRLAVLRSWDAAEDVRQAIRDMARAGNLRWIVLVGDVPEGLPDSLSSATARSGRPEDGAAGSRAEVTQRAARSEASPYGIVPRYEPARRIADFGPDRRIASDNGYADLDNDGYPDVAIGRISVETVEELRAVLTKVQRYETAPTGHWRRRIHLTAGTGGFGPIADGVLEWLTTKLLTERIPAEYTTSFTYANWRSPYCPDPRRFSAVTVERLTEGSLFWVYLGHGHPYGLHWLDVPGGRFRTLDVSDVGRLQADSGWPIALLFACYTGAYDAPQPCLAEGLIRAPGGPVAAVAASRMTMPYGMAVMGTAMIEEYFEEQPATLGELLLQAKRRLAPEYRPKHEAARAWRQLLDQLALALVPGSTADNLKLERQEHVALFQLLGDPLLRLHYSKRVAVQVPAQVEAGQVVRLKIDTPCAGEGSIELLSRRDRVRKNFPARHHFRFDSELLAQFQQEYEATLDPLWIAVPQRFVVGTQEVELSIPAEIHGPCVLRVLVHAETSEACGAAELFVESASPTGAPAP